MCSERTSFSIRETSRSGVHTCEREGVHHCEEGDLLLEQGDQPQRRAHPVAEGDGVARRREGAEVREQPRARRRHAARGARPRHAGGEGCKHVVAWGGEGDKHLPAALARREGWKHVVA